jgi:hypothetical protein
MNRFSYLRPGALAMGVLAATRRNDAMCRMAQDRSKSRKSCQALRRGATHLPGMAAGAARQHALLKFTHGDRHENASGRTDGDHGLRPPCFRANGDATAFGPRRRFADLRPGSGLGLCRRRISRHGSRPRRAARAASRVSARRRLILHANIRSAGGHRRSLGPLGRGSAFKRPASRHERFRFSSAVQVASSKEYGPQISVTPLALSCLASEHRSRQLLRRRTEIAPCRATVQNSSKPCGRPSTRS